mmetsp:Transcript_6629/g.11547  ORF Transcript_6629/g.11547 Transcript_6629/m.11547 type:complete len:228 (-) Transcript_6629:94-777(-)
MGNQSISKLPHPHPFQLQQRASHPLPPPPRRQQQQRHLPLLLPPPPQQQQQHRHPPLPSWPSNHPYHHPTSSIPVPYYRISSNSHPLRRPILRRLLVFVLLACCLRLFLCRGIRGGLVLARHRHGLHGHDLLLLLLGLHHPVRHCSAFDHLPHCCCHVGQGWIFLPHLLHLRRHRRHYCVGHLRHRHCCVGCPLRHCCVWLHHLLRHHLFRHFVHYLIAPFYVLVLL